MFLVFTLLILALWVWLFLNVYASFFPFLQSIGHISEYNVAYYSAISSVERGMLTTKYRDPGFDGSGGTLGGIGRWPMSDQDNFFGSWASQGEWWIVTSRTTTIPGSGEWNVDPFLSTGDSMQYNALRYANSDENFFLTIDNTSDPEEYYSGTWQGIGQYSWGVFSGELRLPPFVVAVFSQAGGWQLCHEPSAMCDSDVQGVYDKEKLVWWLHGVYATQPFSILSTLSVFVSSGTYINYPFDNAWRASLIEPLLLLLPNNFTFVPNGENLSEHKVISPVAWDVKSVPFQDILLNINGDYTNLQFSFGLVSLLRSVQWAIYPYLEYRLSFPQPVADKYYRIEGHGRNRNYDVEIQIKKPTVPGTIGGDFTVIF